LASRRDLFWVQDLEQLEELVAQLLADPARLDVPVAPPLELPLVQLLRRCLGPAPIR